MTYKRSPKDDRYEEWAIARREILHQERLHLLLDLGVIQERRGDSAPAISTLQQAATIDPARLKGSQLRTWAARRKLLHVTEDC
jgi:hypothetical protein